jgi:hypothetical protein
MEEEALRRMFLLKGLDGSDQSDCASFIGLDPRTISIYFTLTSQVVDLPHQMSEVLPPVPEEAHPDSSVLKRPLGQTNIGGPEWWNLRDLPIREHVRLPAELEQLMRSGNLYLLRLPISFRPGNITGSGI